MKDSLLIPTTTAATGLAVVIGGYYWYWNKQRRQRQQQPKVKERTCQESMITFSDMITPSQCFANGRIMYGGELLSSMDMAGAACAFQQCRGPIVTLSIDNVQLLQPAYVHEYLNYTAQVNATFTSSMEIQVDITSENVITGVKRYIGQGRLVFVHLDERTKRAAPVPKLKIETPEEQHRYEQALQRKEDAKLERMANQKDGMLKNNENWKELLKEAELELQKDTRLKIPMKDTVITMTKVVMPQHANPLQITFGGQIMAWMELAASMAAAKFTKSECVTVGLDRMLFTNTSRVGSLLIIQAQVTRVFHTSVEIYVSVNAYNSSTLQRVHCNTGYFTFVTLPSKLKDSNDVTTIATTTTMTTSPDTTTTTTLKRTNTDVMTQVGVGGDEKNTTDDGQQRREPIPYQVQPTTEQEQQHFIMAGIRRQKRLLQQQQPQQPTKETNVWREWN